MTVWTKASNTLANKIKTLIVVDPNDGKIKDLGDSLCVEGAGTGITRSGAQVVNVDRTTGGWGIGFYTAILAGPNTPGTVNFTDIGHGLPKWLSSDTSDGTVIFLINRFRSGDAISNLELIHLTSNHNPVIKIDATNKGAAGASAYTTASTGTTTMPSNTPIGLAMQARVSASNLWKYFYGTKAGGTFSQEGASGSINDSGGTTTISSLGDDVQPNVVEAEFFMVIVCPTEFLSGADMNAILADPVGTLIDTGASTVTATGAGASATTSAPSGSASTYSATITDQLINLAGSVQASLTGLTVLIYKTVPTSATAPAKEFNSVTTDGTGHLNLDVSDIGLTSGDPVWVIIMKDGSPAKGGIRKITPVYT